MTNYTFIDFLDSANLSTEDLDKHITTLIQTHSTNPKQKQQSLKNIFQTSIGHYSTVADFNSALTNFVIHFDKLSLAEKNAINWSNQQIAFLQQLQQIIELRRFVYFNTQDKYYAAVLNRIIANQANYSHDYSDCADETYPHSVSMQKNFDDQIKSMDNIHQLAVADIAIQNEDMSFIEPAPVTIVAAAAPDISANNQAADERISKIMRLSNLMLAKMEERLKRILKGNTYSQTNFYENIKTGIEKKQFKGNQLVLAKKYCTLHEFQETMKKINSNQSGQFVGEAHKLDGIYNAYVTQKVSETLHLPSSSKFAQFFLKIGKLITKPFKYGKRVASGRLFETQHQRFDREIKEHIANARKLA